MRAYSKSEVAVLLVFCAAVIGMISFRPVFAEERVTDDMLQELWGKSHRIMTRQRERILGILEGYLMGDTDSIKKNVSGISDKEAFDIAVGLVHSSAANANNLEAIRRAKQPVFQSDENKVGA